MTKRDVAMGAYRRNYPICQVCGWARHVHVHHIMPLSLGGSNDDVNLVTLCANHHADAHGQMHAFIERDGHRAALLVTRDGLIKHLRKLDECDVAIAERYFRAVQNQAFSAMSEDDRWDAAMRRLNSMTLSDDEIMMVFERRSGRAV